jgi:hypothetical protein
VSFTLSTTWQGEQGSGVGFLASTSGGKEHKPEDFRQKQLGITHRCKKWELSRSTYVSGQREFQTKELLMVGERIYRNCEVSLVSEVMNFVHTIKLLSPRDRKPPSFSQGEKV